METLKKWWATWFADRTNFHWKLSLFLMALIVAVLVIAQKDRVAMEKTLREKEAWFKPASRANDFSIERPEWGLIGEPFDRLVLVTNQTDTIMDFYFMSAGAFAEWYRQGGRRSAVHGDPQELMYHSRLLSLNGPGGEMVVDLDRARPGDYVVFAVRTAPLPTNDPRYPNTTPLAFETLTITGKGPRIELPVRQRSMTETLAAIQSLMAKYPQGAREN